MRFLKLLIGILLIPICAVLAHTVYRLLGVMTEASVGQGFREITWLGCGFVLWVLIYYVSQPARTYIIGHELTHVLWAYITGIRVYGMEIGEDEGNVEMERVNFLVLLAPYFFPIYCMLVVFIYSILVMFIDLSHWQPFWLTLIGLTYAFHVTFTIQALSQHQTDVTENGYLFSYTVIIMMNLILVATAMVIAAAPTLAQLIQFLAEESAGMAELIVRYLILPLLPNPT